MTLDINHYHEIAAIAQAARNTAPDTSGLPCAAASPARTCRASRSSPRTSRRRWRERSGSGQNPYSFASAFDIARCFASVSSSPNARRHI